MEAAAKPARRPSRRLLGWVALAALVLAVAFWGSAWLWRFHEHLYYSGYWFFLMPVLWLLLAGLGILALVLAINYLLQRRGWLVLSWFLVVGFTAANCLVGLLPLAVSFGFGTTPDIPKE